METRLHFSRFEFKYLLPAPLRVEIEAELQYFMHLDPYVASQPDCKYFVRSLYFDDAALTAYYEKIDGVKTRSKYRIRTYGASPGASPEFLEIKGRHNAMVFKHRTPLAARAEVGEAPPATLHDRVTEDLRHRLSAGPIQNGFEFDLDRRRLRPVMLIDYHRRPYVSKYDPEFRLTFDEDLHCLATRHLFPPEWEEGRRVLVGYTVLEVKFGRHVPRWFHRIIQAFELRRLSISKYCAGIDAFALAPRLE